MSSFFNAIKNLLTAYHIDKSSTGFDKEPEKRTKQPFNDCLILFIYSLSTGFDKEPKF